MDDPGRDGGDDPADPHRHPGDVQPVPSPRAATHADVWLNATLTPDGLDDLVRLSRRLDEHCADVGRDPATIRRAVQFRVPDRADEIIRAAERYVRAGFSDLILMPYQGGAGRVEELAGLLPALRALGEVPGYG